jgi:hypothetical protein
MRRFAGITLIVTTALAAGSASAGLTHLAGLQLGELIDVRTDSLRNETHQSAALTWRRITPALERATCIPDCEVDEIGASVDDASDHLARRGILDREGLRVAALDE